MSHILEHNAYVDTEGTRFHSQQALLLRSHLHNLELGEFDS
jgi:hypothetical protein